MFATRDDVPGCLRRLLGASGPGNDLAAWARERGWLGEGSSTSLQAFALTELKCAILDSAKQHRCSRGRQSVQAMRVAALCEELEVPVEPATPSSVLLRRARDALTVDRLRLLSTHASAAETAPILDAINASLRSEFSMRREMLLKRCDVTVQSFLWGDQAKGRENDIALSIQAARVGLSKDAPPVTVADAAAMSRARSRRLAEALDAAGSSSAASDVKKHLMGTVPRRGGDVAKARQDQEHQTSNMAGRGRGGGRHHYRRGKRGGRK